MQGVDVSVLRFVTWLEEMEPLRRETDLSLWVNELSCSLMLRDN